MIMDKYNFKVIAVINSNISKDKQEIVSEKIARLKSILHIVNADDTTYCKEQPFEEYNDFSSVCLFFIELEKMIDCFSKLEYHDLWEGEVRIAV